MCKGTWKNGRMTESGIYSPKWHINEKWKSQDWKVSKGVAEKNVDVGGEYATHGILFYFSCFSFSQQFKDLFLKSVVREKDKIILRSITIHVIYELLLFLTITSLIPAHLGAKALTHLVSCPPPLTTSMLQHFWTQQGLKWHHGRVQGQQVSGSHGGHQRLRSEFLLLSLTSDSTQGSQQPLSNTLTRKIPHLSYFTICWLPLVCHMHTMFWGYKDEKDITPALQESPVSRGRSTSIQTVEQLHDQCSDRARDAGRFLTLLWGEKVCRLEPRTATCAHGNHSVGNWAASPPGTPSSKRSEFIILYYLSCINQ